MGTQAGETTFVMHGARAAVASGLQHVEEQVKAIELAVVENPGLAFDLAKTLIESACKAILTDRAVAFGKNDDLPKLFKMTRQSVRFLPALLEQESAARESLERTLNGLITALQGVCELRNAFGFASHGSGSPRPAMDAVHARLAAQAADAIVGFLYGVHRQELSSSPAPQLDYDDHPDFNEWIDSQCAPIQVLSFGPYRPSEVLFCLDLDAYRDLLANFPGAESSGGTGEEGERA